MSNLGFSTIDFKFEKEIEVCYGFGLWWVCCEISLYFWVLTFWVWPVIGWFGGVSVIGGANGFGG